MSSKRELPPLLVRADADASIGTGHLMRCVALARAWQRRDGKVVFVSRCESRALQSRIQEAGAEFVPLGSTDSETSSFPAMLSVVDRRMPCFVVLDGYHFDLEQQRCLRQQGHRLMVIDDAAHLARYDADILLNQNQGAAGLHYDCGPETQLLLGPEYALLRPEFLAWRGRLKTIPPVARKILVTLGGSDRENVTLRVIEGLRCLNLEGLEIRIVVGPANSHLDTIRRTIDDFSLSAQILTDVSDMASLMAWADLAVSAAGSTCWELACVGLPAVTIVLAENQRRIADELQALGVTVNAGWHQQVSTEQLVFNVGKIVYAPFQRMRMSQRGRALVDGKGADRVVSAMLSRMCVRAA